MPGGSCRLRLLRRRMTSPIGSPDEWIVRARDQLGAERGTAAERAQALPQRSDAAARRQLVRWMGREYGEPSDGVLDVLRTALADDDWEVRASAILVAARLHATALQPEVRDVALPPAGQWGIDEGDAEALVTMRAAAAALLAAHAEPSIALRTVESEYPSLHHDLAALVRADTGQPATPAQLLLHALVTPTPVRDPLPSAVPPGIEVRDDRAWITDTEIEMIWLAPGRFILGGDGTPGSGTAVVRNWILPRGIFISRRPLRASDVAQCGVPAPASDPVDPEIEMRVRLVTDPPLVLTYAHAVETCAALAWAVGAPIRMPGADALECAARGADGRRYPWGNGMQRLTGREASPTLLERFAAPVAQWTATPADAAEPLTMGGPTSPQCATRTAGTACAAVRIAISAA